MFHSKLFCEQSVNLNYKKITTISQSTSRGVTSAESKYLVVYENKID